MFILNLHTNVCSSSLRDCQSLETAQMSFGEWMNRLEGPFNGILLGKKRERILICTANLGESQKHYVEWKKPVSEDYIPTPWRTDRWLSGVRMEEGVTTKGSMWEYFWVQMVVTTRIYTYVKIHKIIHQKKSTLGYDHFLKNHIYPYLCLRKPLNFGQNGAGQGS